MKTRKISLFYLLKWPWLYLRGSQASKSKFNWVNPEGEGKEDHDIEVVFLGDLLGMLHQPLSLSSELKTWIGEPDFLFFNLEAQIQCKFHLPLLRQSFKTDHFFKSLKSSFSKSRIVAGVANNHFHDFSLEARTSCFAHLQTLGIELAGFKNQPCYQLAEGLNVHLHTAWVDQWGGASPLEDFKPIEGTQSLLYVHTGREFSIDPDGGFRDYEKSLNDNVLALIGHHTHRPSGIEWKTKRLVAWSLGNVCTPFGGEAVRWGQVLKLKLKKKENQWIINNALWSFITCKDQLVSLQKSYSKLNFH